jgi:hypothetical protein
MKPINSGLATLDLTLHNTTLQLFSNNPSFNKYAASYLADLRSSIPASPADIEARLHWNKLPPERDKNKPEFHYGRRLYRQGNTLYFPELSELPGFQLVVTWNKEGLLVDGYYRSPSRLLRAAGRLSLYLPRVYAVLIYYLVYFPLARLLYQNRGWHILHAGAVARHDRAVILAGLPGSGKSTFSIALLADPEVKLLSDNLLLFNAEGVYAFPEPLHLDPYAAKSLNNGHKERLIDTGRVFSHGRRDYRFGEDARMAAACPGSLVFLGIAGETKRISLNPGEAIERLLNYDRMAREVDAYEQFAAALDLIAPARPVLAAPRVENRLSALRALVSNLDCSELWLDLESSLSGMGEDFWESAGEGSQENGYRQSLDVL